MRRTIQDLVYSVDPNVKIEPEVEDVRVFSSVNGEKMISCIFSSCYLLPMNSSILSPTFRVAWLNIVVGILWKCVTCNYTLVRVFLFRAHEWRVNNVPG